MRYSLIQQLSERYSLARLCRALGVSRSGYYGWPSRRESALVREDRQLRAEIRAVFHESDFSMCQASLERRVVFDAFSACEGPRSPTLTT